MLIGLTGYAQSGKDTVAQILVDNYGYRRIAFADPIRNLLYATDPIVKDGYRVKSVVDAYGWDTAKIQFPELRSLLQNLGLAVRDQFSKDFWIKQALLGIDSNQNIVVSDVRFENEADYIKTFMGSQLWRIKRLNVLAVNSHISESQLDGYPVDQIFVNNTSVDDLKVLIQTRMRAYI
jgi:hypothetical protein